MHVPPRGEDPDALARFPNRHRHCRGESPCDRLHCHDLRPYVPDLEGTAWVLSSLPGRTLDGALALHLLKDAAQ
jgi:hypothetical protein